MRSQAIAATVLALGLGLTGCTDVTTPPTPEPTRTSQVQPSPTPSPSASGSRPEPRLTTPPPEPVVDEGRETSPEITRADAHELCKVRALSDAPGIPDPRNSYASLDGSTVEAIDGWWRVWIPGVEYLDTGEPGNVALTCVLNGFIDNPTFYGWGGVASDFYPDIDAYFEEFLAPYSG